MTAMHYSALPDPVREAAFYSGVTAKRALAWLFDAALIFALCVVITPFTAFTAIFFWPLLWLVVSFFYRWATLAAGSATWGMRLMAIEIRERDGGRLTSTTAFLHTLGYSLSVALSPLQLISIGFMIVLGRGQGLTDVLLGTAAINRALR